MSETLWFVRNGISPNISPTSKKKSHGISNTFNGVFFGKKGIPLEKPTTFAATPNCIQGTNSSLSLMRLAPNISSNGSDTALEAAKVGPADGLMATLANNLVAMKD